MLNNYHRVGFPKVEPICYNLKLTLDTLELMIKKIVYSCSFETNFRYSGFRGHSFFYLKVAF